MRFRKPPSKSVAVNKKHPKKKRKLSSKQRSARKRKREQNVLFARAWADKQADNYSRRYDRDFKIPLKK
ncbi:hypothetical protein A3207_00770 [Candidatus Methanomassiliicoccus intestinalis]|uniref:Uncharacterized protein n=2 Tax=Candidatus Methanomassiliicoccus intestinalis TaxID=1406512 RepID=R9T5S0_METII|nr:hypothetical protein [Candidatus Methanomassiliicoccus intestinalis]AGN26317.1 hypothetical protein MMINT_09630 [Candidatus Methanomassiliicoccus intestinalis Issoire-Mx1]TQS84609.1 MAG: hypothetical protein A3207_00770 [Candidatus Methanomassiliicoccus intestinalis]